MKIFTLIAVLLLTSTFAMGRDLQSKTLKISQAQTTAPVKSTLTKQTLYFAGTVTSTNETIFVAPGSIKPSTNEKENSILIKRPGRLLSISFAAETNAVAPVVVRRNGIDTALKTTFAGGLGVYHADSIGVNILPGDFVSVAIFSQFGVTITSLSIDLEQ